MKTSDFDFDLPGELIAQRPAVPRNSARLLDLREQPADRVIADLPGILEPGSLLVVNDTSVIPAQLEGHRGEAKIGVTLHKNEGAGEWLAFAKNARRLKLGDVIEFGGDFAAEVMTRDGAEVRLRFNISAESFRDALEEYGRPPLPPYIKRSEAPDQDDVADYQTMFAAHEGAVAAPTAGLHFTPDLVRELDTAGLSLVSLTLHVGAGTFLPVTADSVRDHKMHYEYGEISDAVAGQINAARADNRKIVAIGTTVLRLLESAAKLDGSLPPFRGDTNLFITPGYSFRIVDQLLTNFHLPRSTLFMLVCAFAGMERMHGAYTHAIENRYRFFSYGDATLLERRNR
ncbi:MAG: tRNA preQ1(34) S-adenosylmethionine ribosyltransferase-isomerase QueA [Alphaproteobacteria bacterium]|nr:tRNA preQ1(34) S-adenosylmethionine ribosyltransferase-isomerase QueA [Alphaproteobacteria bacterium]